MREKQRRGFCAMTKEERQRIASLGGTMAHAFGAAHEWTPQEARDAGRRGGLMSAVRKAGRKAGIEAAKKAGLK